MANLRVRRTRELSWYGDFVHPQAKKLGNEGKK